MGLVRVRALCGRRSEKKPPKRTLTPVKKNRRNKIYVFKLFLCFYVCFWQGHFLSHRRINDNMLLFNRKFECCNSQMKTEKIKQNQINVKTEKRKSILFAFTFTKLQLQRSYDGWRRSRRRPLHGANRISIHHHHLLLSGSVCRRRRRAFPK